MYNYLKVYFSYIRYNLKPFHANLFSIFISFIYRDHIIYLQRSSHAIEKKYKPKKKFFLNEKIKKITI